MAEKSKAQTLNKWMWWIRGEMVVEVIRTGHYPTTAIVRLQETGKEIEVEIEDLQA